MRLKTHKVNQSKDSLASVLRLRYEKDDAIDGKNQYKNGLISIGYASSKAQDLQARVFHKQFVEKELDTLDKDRRQLLEIESFRRKRLNEAMKEEKVLANLKEKKFGQYKYETNIEETKMMDDIAISRFRHQSDDAD